MTRHLPNVIVTNFHRRFTGVTATIKSLVPVQRRLIDVGVIDAAGLGLENEWSLIKVAMAGFRQPVDTSYRVWHARRHNEMLAGIFLRDFLFQRWKILFTTASAREPGRFTRFLLGRMDVVIAASRSSARSRARDSAIVHHGVDCSVFRPQSAEDIGTSTAMFPGKQVIGFVGRIRHAKGADIFVSAMLDILPEHRDCVAVLAGACLARHEAFKADLVARINAVGLEDRIVFLDEIGQDELIKLYQEMIIYTACSRHEGFGLTSIEAFACGTPVIATKTGVWSDAVDSEVGALIDAGDKEALVGRLREMVAEPEMLREMGKAARRRAVMHYSIEKEAQALVEIYRQLMRGD